jgi:hypothetical protein
MAQALFATGIRPTNNPPDTQMWPAAAQPTTSPQTVGGIIRHDRPERQSLRLRRARTGHAPEEEQ